ncbi:MAG TPA: alpha/beta hydrolase [Pyrinomonadaceae bacterium]|nr:alpha/beta hydrolase [Pyrinomonadaceae bacterium]
MTNHQRRRLTRIALATLCVALIVALPAIANAQIYSAVTFDAKGDGRDPSLPDAAQLAYRYEKEQDTLWFRIALYGRPNKDAFGVNIAIDTGGDDSTKANWWGANKTFKFDRLVTANVTRAANGFAGTVGVADVAGVNAKQLANLHQNNLQIRVEGDAIVVGVKRTDITDKMTMKLIASVGSNQQTNDDLPNAGSVAIDLSKSTPGVREIDVSRNNLALPKDYQMLPGNRPPRITKTGQGKQALILVPGMYSGNRSFESFIARNQSQYKIFLLTPPGLNGTPARATPAAGASFSELTWTRRLEQDILDLIRKEKLSHPVIVAERQPAAQAAIELAIEHPEQIGGVVLAGTNLVQFFAAPTDPTRKTPIAYSDRGAFVDESWAGKWFKFVTPETWKNGDLRQQLLSVDATRAQTAWDELEAAPLEVKIRYLCEFWASDVTQGFAKLRVPILALVPTFDEKFLADPANAFAKPAFLDSWETLVPKHLQLELVKIPNARMLVLDDQPQAADEAIASFIKKIGMGR